MSVKSDRWIRRMAIEHQMIHPFEPTQIRNGKISYGLSSYGYDMRISNEFRFLTTKDENELDVMDPKDQTQSLFREFKGEVCTIPAGSIVLARSVEYFRIPRDVITICFGKSTYARCGLIVNVTPFEPEWEGFVTIAISNTNRIPAKVYANEGIAQVLFLQSDEVCETSYADKKGKYQRQDRIVNAKL